MAERKAHEVESWIGRPDPACQVILLYGPDRGMVAERARALVEATGVEAGDPFALVRLDASELEAQPGRLLDEARTVPMFSDRRVIWIRGAGAQKHLADDLRILLAEDAGPTRIVIEAGELRKGAPLRSVAEGAPKAMALPCYQDQSRGVDALIDDVLGRHGLAIGADARHALRGQLGGDRLASRAELEKLVLYCLGQPRVEVADVLAMVGDVSGRSSDDALDAVLAGQADQFDMAFTALVAGGGHPFLALSAAMRQFQQLQQLRGEMDRSGRPAAAAVSAARPPVFFNRRKLVETALARWRAEPLRRALDRLQQAVLATRRQPELAAAIARQTLLALLLESARRG